MVKRARLLYGVTTLLLLATEVLIALFVRDKFVRPYLGDVLVVILLYCIVRCVKPTGLRLLPLYIFLFAAAVELAQLADVLSLVGLGDVTLLRILVGGTFSWPDMVCYALGCLLCAVFSHRYTAPQ